MTLGRNEICVLVKSIIVISILFLVIGASYIPYRYYVKATKVNIVMRQIAMSLYEAREMSLNGLVDRPNVSIGVSLDARGKDKSIIQFFAYPQSASGNQIRGDASSEVGILKTYFLEPGVVLDMEDWYDNVFFFFESLSGEGKYFYFDDKDVKHEIPDDIINIRISFGGVSLGSLVRTIRYFTQTNIVDYQ